MSMTSTTSKAFMKHVQDINRTTTRDLRYGTLIREGTGIRAVI
jgi:hypothetical protein